MPDDDSDEPAVAGEVVDEAFSGPGEWLPPADAARRLSISERTLWRRVTAGQYRRQVISGKAQILVPLAGSVPNTAALAVPAAPDTLSVAIIEELRARREQDAELIADLTAGMVRRAEQLGEMKAQLAAERARADAAEAERDRLRERRWWRWWG
jgi:ABC-type Fe3+ transport system permease subunit